LTTLPPTGAGALAEQYPAVWQAYQELGKSADEAGPLDARTRRLIKLAFSIGAYSEGAVHSHARQAVEEGLTGKELHQVALLAITTLGFPSAIAGISWINDILNK